VFTMDVYAKKINSNATTKQLINMGRIVVFAGCVFAVATALAIDSIKGLNLFDVFQSILGFIAPPLSVVFLLAVFWKRTTRLAVNITLSAGSVFSLGVGVLYLWVFPSAQYDFWPHYLLLSFYTFVVLMIGAVVASLLDKNPVSYNSDLVDIEVGEVTTTRVKIAWVALTVVMVILYVIFNGH
ncbi:Na+/glucose cotransporter, partial [Pseudoxanthomonas sp. SGD-10]